MKILGGLLASFVFYFFVTTGIIAVLRVENTTKHFNIGQNLNQEEFSSFMMDEFEKGVQVQGISMKKGDNGSYSEFQTKLMYHGFLVGYFVGISK